MASYISDISVSLCQDDVDDLAQKGFRKLDVDVNKGQGSNEVFIWYKKGPVGITRIQLSYMNDMKAGLKGYERVNKNLCPDSSEGPINLWYFKGNLESDVPIVELDVTTNQYDEAKKFRAGWERMACDLTRNSRSPRSYLWMKREVQTYICKIETTENFRNDASLFTAGYTRMDENTNKGAGGALVYMWYLMTKEPGKAITDLQVSLSPAEENTMVNGAYEKLNRDLNKGSEAAKAYLWFKRGSGDPIQTLSLIMDQASVDPYKKANVQVIEKNIAKTFEYLCFYR